jgi:hypothetical protein
MLLVEGECSRTGLSGRKRVDDDKALVTFDEGGVGEVESTHLVDAILNMKESVQVDKP